MAKKLADHLENIADAGGMAEAFAAMNAGEENEDDVAVWANFEIAASNGDTNARKKRDALAKRMTPEQIEEARESVRKLLKQSSGDTMGLTARRFDQILKGNRKVDNRQKNIRKAIELIDPLPEPDHALHCLMGDDFNAWEIVPAMLELCGAPASRLFIATLGFNKPMVKHLAELVEARAIEESWLLCSHYFQATDKPLYRHAVDTLADCGPRAKINFARSHAKILCMEIDGRHFVMEGSANLRNCNNVEQITLTQSRDLFDFHAGWIQRNVEGC
jgi:hypothetical protein